MVVAFFVCRFCIGNDFVFFLLSFFPSFSFVSPSLLKHPINFYPLIPNNSVQLPREMSEEVQVCVCISVCLHVHEFVCICEYMYMSLCVCIHMSLCV